MIAQYPIAVVREAPNAAGARAFIDYVLSPAGQAILTKHGFLAVVPTTAGELTCVRCLRHHRTPRRDRCSRLPIPSRPTGEVPAREGSRGGDTALWYAVPTSLFLGFILLPGRAGLAGGARPDVVGEPDQTDGARCAVGDRTHGECHAAARAPGRYPLAYVLARRQFPGKWLVETVTDLPLVLPPVTAGVALLMAFGRRGTLGPSLSVLGIELPFTMTAVVLAQFFVAGSFYIRGPSWGCGRNPGGRGSRGSRREPRPGQASGT